MKWIDQATLWKYVMPVTPDQNYMQIRAPHWKIIIMIARLDKKATHKGIVEHYFVCGVSFFLFLRLWQRDCAVKGRKKHRDWPFIFIKHIFTVLCLVGVDHHYNMISPLPDLRGRSWQPLMAVNTCTARFRKVKRKRIWKKCLGSTYLDFWTLVAF